MSTLETLAAELAEETLAAMQATGNERLFVEVSELIGTSSQTLEEAYLTEVRLRIAGQKAREFLHGQISAAKKT